MKKLFLVKIIALIAVSALLLTASVVMISASGTTEEEFDGASIVPSDVVEGDAPISQTSIADKFDIYAKEGTSDNGEAAEAGEEGVDGNENSVAEAPAREAKTIRIYSDEQIAELNARRENGEWYNLTAEEIFYIIDDTKKLFEEYDVIEIAALDGTVSVYHGYPFYSTDEYYASFGIDAQQSYDPFEDLYSATLARISPLHCAVYHDEFLGNAGSDIVIIGADSIPDYSSVVSNYHVELIETVAFANLFEGSGGNGYTPAKLRGYIPGYKAFSGLLFHKHAEVMYIPSTDADNSDDVVSVLNKSMIPVLSNAVVVEVYSQETRELLASVRYDASANVDIVSRIEGLWYEMSSDKITGIPTEEYGNLSDYVAVVTLYGFGDFLGYDQATVRSYTYRPDGNINGFYFGSGEVWFKMGCQIQGMGELNTYINGLLAEAFS